MKSVGAFLIFLLLTTMPVFAQDPADDGHQPPSAVDIVTMMQSKLSLTQDQVSAVTPIIEKYSAKREKLHQSMEDGTADRDSLRIQMKQIRVDEGQELSQVLSAEQMSQWKSLMAKTKHKRGGEAEAGSEGGEHNDAG
jgi:hypothetical protein